MGMVTARRNSNNNPCGDKMSEKNDPGDRGIVTQFGAVKRSTYRLGAAVRGASRLKTATNKVTRTMEIMARWQYDEMG